MVESSSSGGRYQIDAQKLWIGGLMAGIVAAGVAIVGLLIVRGVFDIKVFVTGNSAEDFATVKYDAAGTEQWVRRYNGPGAGADWATSVAIDAYGNSYVSGSSYGNAATQYDFATLSYDPSGTVRWRAIQRSAVAASTTPPAMCATTWA